MSKILITTTTFGTLSSEPIDKLKAKGFEVVMNPYGRRITTEELRNLLPGIIGMIAGTEIIDRETMKNSQLKVISRCGSGISDIDLAAAKELGIIVRNTPDATTNSVAELTLGGILVLLRHISQMDGEVHGKKWDKKMGAQLCGKKVLIIGFGRIGKRLAKLMKPFGVEIMAVDPALSGIVDEVPIVSLEQGLPQADIICLHPSGSEMILDRDKFNLMKQGVYLSNAARGENWDEEALVEALRSGRVAGAYVDVFVQEPYTGPLTEFPQMVLTPHIGSYSRECRVQMEIDAVNNLLAEIGLL